VPQFDVLFFEKRKRHLGERMNT